MADTLLTLANWLLPLAYLVLMIDYGATFFLRTKTHARNAGVLAVVIFHAMALVLRSVHLGRLPLEGGHEILSLVALSTAVVYCVLEAAVRDRRAGLFIFILVFLFQYTAAVFMAGAQAEQGGGFSWTRLHILPAIFSYTAFAVGAIYGLLHILAHRNLKQHSVGVLFDRLPPFDLLARMTWYAMVVGFIFMTVSIATGPILASRMKTEGVAPIWDPRLAVKVIVGSIAWIIYGVAILGRVVGKWPAPRVSAIGLTGFVVTVILIIATTVLA